MKLTICLASLLLCSAGATAAAPDAASVRKLFKNPHRDYATAPLWVWNDRLTEAQIRETLRDLAGQQVKQAFVHPRPGLMTPYLSEEWFRLWKAALDEAERLDMNLWIYDENSYPSGFAGGFVPDSMPEARGRGLHFKESTNAPAWSESTVAVFKLGDAAAEDVSAGVRDAGALPVGRYLAAVEQRAGNSPWHGNRSYVNLLDPGVTERFLDITLGAYQREIGAHFGKRVPGCFTDEPEIVPAGGLPWAIDLPREFERRRGYPLVPVLASLQREIGDWQRVRHDYYQTLLELFIERWARPYYDRCSQLGLEFTGHYWEHEWPNCVGVPDNMAMAAWQHRPGIDTLMNQYSEDTHAQFGNIRAPKEVSSIANQLGRSRTLVELYGAGGWDLRFEDMKRIADWLVVLGINTLDEHLSYVTLRGARKRDHPQSFSRHEPWWPDYQVMARYLTRLCAVMSQGEQVHRILLIEPTTTAWMYQGNGDKLGPLGASFAQLVKSLEAAQVGYDLGCEDVIAREGSVATAPQAPGSPQASLRVGRRHYDTVVLPQHLENLEAATVELLGRFMARGGTVLALDNPPARVSGRVSDAGRNLAAAAGSRWQQITPQQLPDRLVAASTDFAAQRAEGDRGILFHHRRQLADGQIVMLVNTSMEHPSAGTLRSRGRGVERWDPFTGQTSAHPFERSGTEVSTRFELPPCGSLLLFVSDRSLKPPRTPRNQMQLTATLPGPVQVERLEPNVLTVDYVDVTAGGETRSNVYFYAANQFVWRQNGMERNPWDSAVQFRDELIARTFPAGSGFTATYRFTIQGAVPPDLEIVIERPDLYAITCNGQPAHPLPGASWLDPSFGRIPLAALARTGGNAVSITAQPFTMYHELEPAYVRGGFALAPTDHGFVVSPDRPIELGRSEGLGHSIAPDGTMWLSGGIGFGAGPDGQPVEDRAPFLVFDLGREVALGSVRLWNYNENDQRNLTTRGIRRLRLSAPADASTGPAGEIGLFTLAPGSGEPDAAQSLPLAGRRARFVRLDVLENHAGTVFPAVGTPPDNGFVGLAEVQFLDTAGNRVEGVAVAAASSELASRGRRAVHAVDGSGLAARRVGWNAMGHPFYPAAVAYRQIYPVQRKQGRYRVQLGDWHGSVARVLVNGKAAGHIVSAPWECDITEALRRGENTLEVQVVGTLKNLLGPHHGGRSRGSAWPGMFQQGPAEGPPPGAGYDTIAYGLFEPFAVRQDHTR